MQYFFKAGSFHPILVRLDIQTETDIHVHGDNILFSSHTGSIRSLFLLTRRFYLCRFQSQTGSIRSGLSEVLCGGGKCFNPKLVRLEAAHVTELEGLRERFNPKLVRLEDTECKEAAERLFTVSIPNWFD